MIFKPGFSTWCFTFSKQETLTTGICLLMHRNTNKIKRRRETKFLEELYWASQSMYTLCFLSVSLWSLFANAVFISAVFSPCIRVTGLLLIRKKIHPCLDPTRFWTLLGFFQSFEELVLFLCFVLGFEFFVSFFLSYLCQITVTSIDNFIHLLLKEFSSKLAVLGQGSSLMTLKQEQKEEKSNCYHFTGSTPLCLNRQAKYLYNDLRNDYDIFQLIEVSPEYVAH